MRRTEVFVLLLLRMDLQVNATVDETSPAQTSRPEKKVETEDGASETNPQVDTASPAFLGKLLVVPPDGSHWVGIKAIAEEMGRRGHKVTVVIPEISLTLGPGKHYDTVTFPVPYDKAHLDFVMCTYRTKVVELTQLKAQFLHLQQKLLPLYHMTAESLLFNASLISHLEQQGFDALLTDPIIPTGTIVARKLGLPTINLLRSIPCSLDMRSAGCPSPPSYVPRFFTSYTDKMNFKQRLLNTVVSFLEPLMCQLLYWQFDNMAHQFLGDEVSTAQMLSDTDIWLLRFDFTLDFPRPLMPNFIIVGGINCKVRTPLSEDLESWVSEKQGFVVFALGTMVSHMPEEITSVFLQAFKQIPQKVIWRYTGQVPGNVPENVKIMTWIPQNDLLAHPGARAFITHAGSHSLFEGLCHAVPMVMLPIQWDQTDNAHRLASRGAGVVFDIYSMSSEDLVLGLNEVINKTRCKENIQKLSILHKDRPVEPLNLSVYWTEFVMRHKGAKHLKAAVSHLNWFQYFCLDVVALLAFVGLVSIGLTVKCFKLCLRKVSGKRKLD
ncbi:UDP-glucuronosyltransferase 1-6-like isoform X2 [Betta splendens]|uniref:glucuronosyltransferase n=1 Tax=Betta splendens TaxID=158456 RepID=A0A6P7M9R4_BETSP|nr:UDP-glucuronosyltransferase 1-6-like isoform X2 [Betta splendens]